MRKRTINLQQRYSVITLSLWQRYLCTLSNLYINSFEVLIYIVDNISHVDRFLINKGRNREHDWKGRTAKGIVSALVWCISLIRVKWSRAFLSSWSRFREIGYHLSLFYFCILFTFPQPGEGEAAFPITDKIAMYVHPPALIRAVIW